MQRKLETAIRHAKDRQKIAKAAGDDTLRRQEQKRLNDLTRKYKDFSEKAGLSVKKDRMSVSGYHRVKPLDNGGGSGIMNSNGISINSGIIDGYPYYSVDYNFVNSNEYSRQFDGLFESSALNSKVKTYATKTLEQNDNAPSETMYAIPVSGIFSKVSTHRKPFYWLNDDNQTNDWVRSIKNKFVIVHNHPNNTPLSFEDIIALNDINNMEAIISIGHDGKICKISMGKAKKARYTAEYDNLEWCYGRCIRKYGQTNEAIEAFCEEIGWKYGRENL